MWTTERRTEFNDASPASTSGNRSDFASAEGIGIDLVVYKKDRESRHTRSRQCCRTNSVRLTSITNQGTRENVSDRVYCCISCVGWKFLLSFSFFFCRVPSQAAEEQDQHNVKECDAFDEEGDSVFDTVDLHESEHSFGSLKNLSESTEPILKLHFVTGAAFTDNLDDEYHKDENRKCFYVVHVLFRDQRFRSPTIPVGPEPKFNCVFNLRLPAFSSKHLSDREMLNKMLASSDLIHCSLVQISTRSQSDPSSPVEFESKLISSWTLEWRDALVTGKRALRVELPQIGDASALTELPVGLVDVRLNVVLENCITGSSTPLAEVVRASESPLITPQEVDKKIRSERKQRNRVGQELASYTRNWYSELKHFVPQNRRYLYKITRRTMLGENRPITSFVKPFKPGHLIPSLHHAARFVSLFPSQVRSFKQEFLSGRIVIIDLLLLLIYFWY